MPTNRSEQVQVEHLAEFQRELRALDKAWPRELRLANLSVAEMVAERTRTAFLGRPGSAPKVADTVKALAQQRNASVRIGGGRSVGGQVAMGNEFGSLIHKQFPPWRGSGSGAGYALWPTIRAARGDIVEAYGDAVDRLAKQAFPDA